MRQRRNWKIPGKQKGEKVFVVEALEGNLGKMSNKDVKDVTKMVTV